MFRKIRAGEFVPCHAARAPHPTMTASVRLSASRSRAAAAQETGLLAEVPCVIPRKAEQCDGEHDRSAWTAR